MALGQMLLLLNPCQEFLPKQRRSARSALGGGGPHRSQRPLNPRNELGLPTNTTNRVAMTNRNHVSPLWRLQVQDRGAAGGSAEGLCWVWTAGSSLCLQRCTLRAHGITASVCEGSTSQPCRSPGTSPTFHLPAPSHCGAGFQPRTSGGTQPVLKSIQSGA